MKRAVLLLLLAVAIAAAEGLPEMRMTPAEIVSREVLQEETAGDTTGTSGVMGVHSTVIAGDPSKPGYYAILLFVPRNTTIEAHSHPDDRIATVVSGIWRFGYGKKFDPKALVELPSGSVYTEPAGRDHFAQSGNDHVVVQISGMGPSGTRYADPSKDPSRANKAASSTAVPRSRR
jgi:quercetin dioxygenase-like cupin family protein